MVEIEFNFEQRRVTMQANLDDYLSTIINKYCAKTQLDKNSVIFITHSMQIKEDKKVKEIMNQIENINKRMYIAVFPLIKDENESVFVDSKDIICPKCSNLCRIKIEDYNVKLYECKNNHISIIKLDKFQESQKVDLSKIRCDICNINNMGKSYEHTFYYCLNCNANVCVLCKEKHNINHFIVNYELKNYKCPIHYDSYFKYCRTCKINICMLCNPTHSNHNLESFENLVSNPDNKRSELDKLKNEIDNFNKNVKKIIFGLNQIIENMENYYNIFNKIFNNYNVNNKNYYELKNINQINNNNNIYNEILKINQNKNYPEKINQIINIYYKMQGKNNLDPFGFSTFNDNENDILGESNTLFLFSNIPSYITKESKISQDCIYRCNYCPYTPLMKIMYKGYQIFMEYRCQNGHYSFEKLYDFYQRNKINSIKSAICCVGYEVNDGKQNFYYCNDCKQYYCEKDKIVHEKIDDKPHNLINLKYLDNFCNEHMIPINDYCLDCHKNICIKCISHKNHKKISLSKIIIDDNELSNYRIRINELKENYNKFYDECDKTIKEVLEYIENFNNNLKKFKYVNDYSFNICQDLINSYVFLKNKKCLNYEIIENIKSILNFNDIKFNMDENFNCIAKLIYINSIIKLEYNTLFKLNNNFINFDMKISEEEEKLIKSKNIKINDLTYQKIKNTNFEDTYYGYFKYNPEDGEEKYEINGFGIIVNKNYKYIGEFKGGKRNGCGVYYYDNGSFEYTKQNRNTVEAYKLYDISGESTFCYYNKIINRYQKYGVAVYDMPNGTKRINIIKNNNYDDYGISYNIDGELYEGYYLSNAKNGYGILNSQAEGKIIKGVFEKDKLKFGKVIYKDWIIEGEYKMGLKDGYIIEYDELYRKQYEGQYKNGKKEGFGIKYYDNGNIYYKGYFRNNLEDIFGFMYTSSGKLFYYGHVDKGNKKGFGIYYAYDQKGKKLYQYSGNWINDDKCDGYLLKKFPDGDYFFGFTKMFVYQDFMKLKLGNMTYIGETKSNSTKREGYGETLYSNGKKEKGIYINNSLVLKKNN